MLRAVVARGRTSAVGCELLLLCGFPLRVFTDLLLAELGILDVEDDRVCVPVTETHVRLEPREQLAVRREALPLRHREVLLRALARLGLDVVDVCLVSHTIRSIASILPVDCERRTRLLFVQRRRERLSSSLSRRGVG